MKMKYLIPTILMLIFEVIVGVLLIVNGEKFTQVIFISFGVLLLISGLFSLIATLFGARNGGLISTPQLVLSIVLLGIGAFFTAASGSVMEVMASFTVILGIIIAFNGILKLAEFFNLRQVGPVMWFAAVGSIVTIIVGFLIAFNPFGATTMMWTILGILIIISAVFDVISLIIFTIALKKTPAIVKQDMIDTDGDEAE